KPLIAAGETFACIHGSVPHTVLTMESIFETMEQTRIVDRVLFWMAIFLPLFTSGLAFVLKDEKVVTRNRHRWVLVALAGPAVLILWNVYNRVVDHFGLDSVKGLVV